jgi:YD repeat-containing protein
MVDKGVGLGRVGRFRACKSPCQHKASCMANTPDSKKTAWKAPASILLSRLRFGGLLARIHHTFTHRTAVNNSIEDFSMGVAFRMLIMLVILSFTGFTYADSGYHFSLAESLQHCQAYKASNPSDIVIAGSTCTFFSWPNNQYTDYVSYVLIHPVYGQRAVFYTYGPICLLGQTHDPITGICVTSCPSGQIPNRDTGICELPPKNNGPSTSCGIDTGNPINASTGNKWQHEIDLLETNSGLGFDRYYNAGTTANIAYLGSGWMHPYARIIVDSSSSPFLEVFRSDGKKYVFNKTTTTYTPDADITDILTELKDASGMRTGWKYTTSSSEIEIYDFNGKLLSITDRTGQTQTLAYSCETISATCPVVTPTTVAPYAGLLVKVTDNFGNSLNFTYNSAGQMATMADPAGNITRYGYDASGNLSTVTYPDDTPTDLTNNPKKTYLYGELANTAGVSQPNALTGIIDENGVRYATYQYDANGKAISTEHTGSVEKYSLNYAADGSSTSVTDPLGSIRTTHFTTVLGVVKPTGTDQPGGSGCAAASSAVTYDANGNTASKTDFNGHKACYDYDLTRNLETARVEGLPSVADCAANLAATSLPGAARKVTTSWHATYRLPLQVAEPKQLTTYSYDASGNMLSHKGQATTDLAGTAGLTATVTGTPRTWAYTYNTLGQVLTADGPRTDVVDKATYTYDVAGNLATVTNPLNQATTLANYDANGRVGTVTAPNGIITALAYTPRGWLKALTVTGGANSETTQYSYDPTGLLKTVTQPDSSVLTYGYDAAHRLTSVTDSLGKKVTYTLDNMGNRTSEQATDPGNVLRRNITRVYDALDRLKTVTGAMQ